MPQWIHDRAKHIQAKNPGMDESKAWAIATQQSHALGKSPKGYGTSEGRKKARNKYDTPSDDKKTADPGGLGKEASRLAPMLSAFSDELQKIANTSGMALATPTVQPTPATTVTSGVVGSQASLNRVKMTGGRWSKAHAAGSPGPASQAQPLLNAPAVR